MGWYAIHVINTLFPDIKQFFIVWQGPPIEDDEEDYDEEEPPVSEDIDEEEEEGDEEETAARPREPPLTAQFTVTSSPCILALQHDHSIRKNDTGMMSKACAFSDAPVEHAASDH